MNAASMLMNGFKEQLCPRTEVAASSSAVQQTSEKLEGRELRVPTLGLGAGVWGLAGFQNNWNEWPRRAY